MRELPSGPLTLLFTDIEGSTRLLQRLGSQYAAVLAESRRLLRSAFKAAHGYEVDTQGDSFFVVFERASDAIVAATAAQRAFFKTHWPADVAVRVRMGIHTGEPQAIDEGYVGLDVHRAARIMSAAHGGQVLLSSETRELVAGQGLEDVSLQDLGEYRLKDIAGQTRLFQLVAPDLPARFPPLTTPRSLALRNLPALSSSFVGREVEVAEIAALLAREEVRLLTLLGPGGVGKTRLALQVALHKSRSADEDVCFVALDSAHTYDEVLFALAQALTIQQEQGRALLEQVRAVLRAQPLLLVLDNFEHVVSAHPLITDLLNSCPTLKILVTSRVLLHLQAEHLYDVSPLPLPTSTQISSIPDMLEHAALALFVQRAQAVLSSFQLTTGNASDILKICSYLDGMPLALELAAAQMRHFTPAQLLARLEQGALLLHGRAQDVAERQQNLRAAIAWSYHLLEPVEQAVFRHLSVFAGAITLEAVEQVCRAVLPVASDHVAEVLANLVDKSMLRRHVDERSVVRFSLLQILREYGLSCLHDADELAAAEAAHGTYMLTWVEQNAYLLTGAEQIMWLEAFDEAYANIRLALTWLLDMSMPTIEQREQALRFCAALVGFWEFRCYFEEASGFMDRALRASSGVSSALKAQALHNAGFFALMQGRIESAEASLRESQLLFRESGDRAAMVNILRLQGNLALMKNNFKIANRLLEEAMLIDRDNGNLRRGASSRDALAQGLTAQGSYQKALALFEENRIVYTSLGDRYSLAYPLLGMARAHFLADGDLFQARLWAEESLALFEAVGNKRLLAHARYTLGQICYACGEVEQGRMLFDECYRVFAEMHDQSSIVDVLLARGRAASAAGDWTLARTMYAQAQLLVQSLEIRTLRAEWLEGYGVVLAQQQEPLVAVQLWGEAAAIRAVLVAPMPPAYRATYLQAINLVRTHLDQDSFQTAWLAGSRSS